MSGLEPSRTYIETGCYEGRNLAKVIASGKYKEIHTIELSPRWYEHNKKQFEHFENVSIHLGDSTEVLGEMDYSSSVTIFLDAHYSGPGTAHGKLETPLLEELKILAESKLTNDSVIIIDDIRMLGYRGLMPGNGVNYFAYEADWHDITLEQIKNIMGLEYSYLTNESSWLTQGPEDQLLIFKTSAERATAMHEIGELLR